MLRGILLLLASSWALAVALVGLPAGAHAELALHRAGEQRSWPAGTDLIPFEVRSGLILVKATLHSPSGRDTSGLLIVDTGAPDLALGVSVWNALNIDTLEVDWGYIRRIHRTLTALELGAHRVANVEVGGVVVDSILDRGVLGFFAPSFYRDRAVVIDYESRLMAVVNRRLTVVGTEAAASPQGSDLAKLAHVRRSRACYAGVLGPGAVPVSFRLFQGGRMLVSARVAEPASGWRSQPLSLLLDTGASACVVFEDAMAERVRPPSRWPRRHDVPFRTVLGSFREDATLLPKLLLTDASPPVEQEQVATGITPRGALPDIQGELPDPIHGLVGSTFLARFRILFDYGNQVLWLEDRPRPSVQASARSQVGLRLERLLGEMQVVAVETGSSAEAAGIRAGDVAIRIDRAVLNDLAAGAAEELLQGEPGSEVVLVLRRDNMERVCALRRRGRL
ncbi:MAG TPA: PDZ domain-containing protein [Candidatus Eisenbacteria bacterium]